MRRAAVALALLGLAGCGTVVNTCWRAPEEGGRQVYGGVGLNVEAGQQALAQTFHPRKPADVPEGIRVATLCALDLPLSAVGDTLTLPWTLATPADTPRVRRVHLESGPCNCPHHKSKEHSSMHATDPSAAVNERSNRQ